jgi:hypothetical protein
VSKCVASRAGLLALGLCALAFGGCAPPAPTALNPATPVRVASRGPIPLPDRALLERQGEPDCAFRGPVSSPATPEETRMKLDYEQQCYRQAESIVRSRLNQLQDSVDETVRAASQR